MNVCACISIFLIKKNDEERKRKRKNKRKKERKNEGKINITIFFLNNTSRISITLYALETAIMHCNMASILYTHTHTYIQQQKIIIIKKKML